MNDYMIHVDMIDAVMVKFKKPIFEDDFPEVGMVAWLTAIEWNNQMQIYRLMFDFSEFEARNEKYFIAQYYPNAHTPKNVARDRFTAKEAGLYDPKYSVYFQVPDSRGERDDADFSEAILDYLIPLQKDVDPVVKSGTMCSFNEEWL